MDLVKAIFHAMLNMPEWLLEKILGRFRTVECDEVERWGGRICLGIVVVSAVAVTYLAL